MNLDAIRQQLQAIKETIAAANVTLGKGASVDLAALHGRPCEEPRVPGHVVQKLHGAKMAPGRFLPWGGGPATPRMKGGKSACSLRNLASLET
mgnify:CR=1 FL=1